MKRPIPAMKASTPNMKMNSRSDPSGEKKRSPPSTRKMIPATSGGFQDSDPQAIQYAMAGRCASREKKDPGKDISLPGRYIQ
jgi:hypothetical protein